MRVEPFIFILMLIYMCATRIIKSQHHCRGFRERQQALFYFYELNATAIEIGVHVPNYLRVDTWCLITIRLQPSKGNPYS